jgi:hypothetical protein
MTQRIPDDEVREASSWLVNLIQTTAVNDPDLLRAIERAVRAIVIDHRRQAIAERLERLDSRCLEEVDAFLNTVERLSDDPGIPT